MYQPARIRNGIQHENNLGTPAAWYLAAVHLPHPAPLAVLQTQTTIPPPTLLNTAKDARHGETFGRICLAWFIVGVVDHVDVELNWVRFQEVVVREEGEVAERAASA